jgi:transposase
MGKRLSISGQLSVGELEKRYRESADGASRSQWQIIWLVGSGQPSEVVAQMTGYSRQWIRKLAGRYTALGEAGIGDKRAGHSGRKLSLNAQQQAALAQAMEGSAPDGEAWTGPKVAAWMSDQLGRPVHVQRGWEMMRRLGYSSQTPRRRHAKADSESQQLFKKTSRR